jgi:apolipoprotein N-acyltransferase
MVRSTPTGVSAIIDPYGRIPQGQALGLRKAGVIDADLPAPLPPTLYSQWRNLPFWLLLALGGFVSILLRFRYSRRARDGSLRPA